MGSIPELFLHDATTNEEFESYFRELEDSLSRWDIVRERELRLIDVVKYEETDENGVKIVGGKLKVKDEDFLRFVPLGYGEFKVIALFQAENDYLLGFLTKEKVCSTHGSRRRTCYIIAENNKKNEETIDVLKRCVDAKYDSNNIFKDAKLGEGYPILEEIAGFRRTKILLGRQALIDAIKFLSADDEDSVLNNRPTMAKHCIVIIQMFCESFRCRKLAVYRLDKFVNGFYPPEDLLLEEHGWSIASGSLQSESDANNYNLHVADVREDALSDADLHQMYDLLQPCFAGQVKEAQTSHFHKVLVLKYLYVWFKKLLKSRPVEFESTEEVTAVLHIFREYMVLQYNHLQLSQRIKDVEVDVEVLPCTSLRKIEHQPLRDIQGRTFVTFERVNDGPEMRFLSQWRAKDITVDTKNLPSLNVIQLPSKDYFHSEGINDFYKAQKDLKSQATCACLHFSHHTLYKGMTLDDAKTGLEGLFELELGDDQVDETVQIKPRIKGNPPEGYTIPPKAPSKKNKKQGASPKQNRKLVHALYLKKFQVFLSVLFNRTQEKVQLPNQLSKEKVVTYAQVHIVCEEECRDAIVEIFKDWQEDKCTPKCLVSK